MKTFKHYLEEIENPTLTEEWTVNGEPDDEEDNTSNSGNNTARSLNTPTPPNSFIPTHFHIPYTGGKIPLMMAKPGEFWEKTNNGMKLFLPPDIKVSDLEKETKPGILQNYSVDGEYAPDGKLTWTYKDNETWFNGLHGNTKTFWTPERVGYVPRQATASASAAQPASDSRQSAAPVATTSPVVPGLGNNPTSDNSTSNKSTNYDLLTPLEEPTTYKKYTDYGLSSAPKNVFGSPIKGGDTSTPAQTPVRRPDSPSLPPAEKPAEKPEPPKPEPPKPEPPKPEPPKPEPPKPEPPKPAEKPDLDKVRRLQELLKQAGVYNGPIDGAISAEVRSALEKYKQKQTPSSAPANTPSTNSSSNKKSEAPSSPPLANSSTPPQLTDILNRVDQLRKKYPVPESKSTIDSPVEQMQRIRQLIDEAEWGRQDLRWIPDAETQTKIDAARAANPPPKSPWDPSLEVQAIIDAEKAAKKSPEIPKAGTPVPGTPGYEFTGEVDARGRPKAKKIVQAAADATSTAGKATTAATEPVKTPASNKPVAALLRGPGVAQEPIVNLDVRNPPAGTPSSGVWSKIKNVPGVNAAGKLVGRVAPGAGVALGALDVANRYQAGDTTGAAIAGATAAASSIPGIGTAAAILGTSVQALRDKIRTGKLFPNEEEIISAVAKDSEGENSKNKDTAQLQKDLTELQRYLNDSSIGPDDKIKIKSAIEKINKILKQG